LIFDEDRIKSHIYDLMAHFNSEAHQLGTTRMSDSSRNGVVDANCRSHDVDDLFVVGGSVFPTSGYANPLLTIVALSVRLAAHLQDRLREGVASGRLRVPVPQAPQRASRNGLINASTSAGSRGALPVVRPAVARPSPPGAMGGAQPASVTCAQSGTPRGERSPHGRRPRCRR
jgi:hypothetical protein